MRSASKPAVLSALALVLLLVAAGPARATQLQFGNGTLALIADAAYVPHDVRVDPAGAQTGIRDGARLAPAAGGVCARGATQNDVLCPAPRVGGLLIALGPAPDTLVNATSTPTTACGEGGGDLLTGGGGN